MCMDISFNKVFSIQLSPNGARLHLRPFSSISESSDGLTPLCMLIHKGSLSASFPNAIYCTPHALDLTTGVANV